MHEPAVFLQEQDCDPGFPALVAQFSAGRLAWWPELGIGYYPVDSAPYDQAYFDRFERDAKTCLGRALMEARCDFVDQHYQGTLVDVGIGCGAFIEARRKRGCATCGYDINPASRAWLRQQNLMVDPYHARFDAMTLWDVLEHVAEFPRLLENVSKWLFLSLPIFRDAEHALRSKHFRPDEHCWYFSRDGLLFAMEACGFGLVSESLIETELGREDIGTFAFRRVAA
jgi:Methyltransferase domain